MVEKSAYYPNLITVQNYIIFLTLPNIFPYISALPRIFHYYSHPRAPKVTKRQPGMAASSFYLVGIHHISRPSPPLRDKKTHFSIPPKLFCDKNLLGERGNPVP